MRISLNGEQCDIADGTTVVELLRLRGARLARSILPHEPANQSDRRQAECSALEESLSL